MKAFLIALAALAVFDAAAAGGHYRAEVIHSFMVAIHQITAMGWSMTLS